MHVDPGMGVTDVLCMKQMVVAAYTFFSEDPIEIATIA